MKAKKHYANNHVIVYASEGKNDFCITLENEQQMKRLGECLRDLARIGGDEVEIN